MKVADLMQIPAADGLFHKGLIMSGVSGANMLPSCVGSGEQIVTAMLTELGLTKADASKLETLPYPELVKTKTAYVCDACGYESAKWLGRCPACNQWNTFKEFTVAPRTTRPTMAAADRKDASRPIRLSQVNWFESVKKAIIQHVGHTN